MGGKRRITLYICGSARAIPNKIRHVVRRRQHWCLRHRSANTYYFDLHDCESTQVLISIRMHAGIRSTLTFEVNDALLWALDCDGFIRCLVAFQFRCALTQSDKALFTFQHQNRAIYQIEIELGNFFNRFGCGKQMARSFSSQEFSIVRTERDGTVTVPYQFE